MKKLMLIGRSRCGKTTLLQSLQRQPLHDQKTQALEFSDDAIDTPGEYLENRCLYSALISTACEADIIGFVQSADTPQSCFAPQFARAFTKPVIGIITKADQCQDPAQLDAVTEQLKLAGIDQLFVTSATAGDGIVDLRKYLCQLPSLETRP